MDENARRIFDEAFATLDDTAHLVPVVARIEARGYSGEYQPKPPKLPAPTIEEIEALKTLADARQQAVGIALGEERARHREQIEKVRKEFADEIAKLDLRLSALLIEATKRQTIAEAAERATVIDLPSQRRG